MTDSERLDRAFQEYMRERRILKGNSTQKCNHLIAMALIRIVNLLEKSKRKGAL